MIHYGLQPGPRIPALTPASIDLPRAAAVPAAPRTIVTTTLPSAALPPAPVGQLDLVNHLASPQMKEPAAADYGVFEQLQNHRTSKRVLCAAVPVTVGPEAGLRIRPD
jgi:hypothetical protein